MDIDTSSLSKSNMDEWRTILSGEVAQIFYDDWYRVYWVGYEKTFSEMCYTLSEAKKLFEDMTLHFQI